ncbi:MAG: cation transporter [Campylobacteraceae bacterium]|jgi:cation diffusion facilitator family transporter|nr:cation transporter [Campylobacteraceae bacterium]
MNPKEQAAKLSVISNTALVIGKLSIGVAISSIGVISEGIHSSLDLLAAIIAFFAVRQASHPADEKHKYGHGKIENLSGTLEAVLILIAAFWIVLEAVQKLLHPHAVESIGWGMGIMAVSSTVNFFISRHLMKVGIETDSIALRADAMHLRTDVLTSAGVMVGLFGMYLTGWQWLDPIAAMLVAGLIVHAAWELLRESFAPLLDASLPEDEEQKIKDKIENYKDSFLDFHSFRSRKAGSERHVDFHLTVCKYHTIEYAHNLADKIEEDIQMLFSEANILIHLEPCSDKCDGRQRSCKTC